MSRNAVLIALCLVTSSATAQNFYSDEGLATIQRPDRIPAFRHGYGHAHLPITCQYRRTQMLFDQGLAMLHGFDRRSAMTSFYFASVIEPEAPAGWLGMALATLDHPRQAREYTGKSLQLSRNASPLEAAMINAVHASTEPSNERHIDPRIRLAAAWRNLIPQFPDESALRALFVQHTLEAGDGQLSDEARVEVVAELNKVLELDSQHALHTCAMLIGAAQNRDSALTASLKACDVASQNPHVWRIAGTVCADHMAFSQSIDMLEHALRLFHQEMSRDGLLPDETPGYVDTCDELVKSLAHAGHIDSAVTLARHMTRLPATRSWLWDNSCRDPQCVCVRGAVRLIWLLSELERWEEVAEFTAMADFSGPDSECVRRLAAGRAAFALNRPDLLQEQLQHLLVHDAYCEAQKQRLQNDSVQRRRVVDIQQSEVYWTQQRQETDAARLELAWLSTLNQRDLAEARRQLSKLKRPYCWEPLTDLLMEDHESATASAEKILLRAPDDAIPVVRARSVFERLGDTKRLHGIEAAWQRVQAADTGKLAANLLWQPSHAESWTMPDREADLHSLDDYQGKSVLMVYYLGAGCPHCIEQLQVMAPMKSKFENAGLSIVTVSSDSIEGLAATFQVVGADESLPFLVLSDQDRASFQTYGAWNEFDREPLHGMYLIDANGRILWAIRGAQPFLNLPFFLDEAQRLLHSNAATSSPGIQANP